MEIKKKNNKKINKQTKKNQVHALIIIIYKVEAGMIY